MISPAYAADAGHAAVAFYADAGFWVSVSLAVVAFMLFKPVMRAATAALDERAARIRAHIDEAVKLREDAQEMLAIYQRKQRDAMKEAEDIIAHAKTEAERLAAQAAKELDASLKRREQQATDRIAAAEAQALKEVKNLAVDIAVEAARTVIAQSLTAEQSAALVDAAIKDLPQKIH